MGSEAERDLGEERYWRRRVAALAGVFGAIAFVGWACSASGGEEAEVETAAPSVPAAMPTVTVTAKVTRSARPVRSEGCAPKSVVVTLTPDSGAYGPGGRPEFRVTAVNTGSRPCRFDVGSHHLDLRITSGDDRVWSSAECVPGRASEVRTLRRGVPYVDTVVWDRRRCTGEHARPGTYVASLHSGTVRVPGKVFRLS
ncbi:hypothetical protein [Actinomadura rugatobispora]|uniref:DUF4232 domain-containing protein n=1 Tax=Actinomadura rugatobispora TaxID=1994 RepID=A0ABW1AG69_9ACTN|nr:hypothetical protein GCM10010200_031540 [Actinomadura rugatobispora]